MRSLPAGRRSTQKVNATAYRTARMAAPTAHATTFKLIWKSLSRQGVRPQKSAVRGARATYRPSSRREKLSRSAGRVASRRYGPVQTCFEERRVQTDDLSAEVLLCA